MSKLLCPGEWWESRHRLMDEVGAQGEMSSAVLDHWAAMGMKKELYSKGIKFSLFTPAQRSVDRKFPVLFLMHMGGDSVYSAEWYGFVEQAARRGYIIACPAWRDGPNDEATKREWEESGLTREGFVFRWVLERMRELALPMDESRMYTVGMSGGGNAAAFAAMEFPELIAATSPSTGAALQGSGVAKGKKTAQELLVHMQTLGMGLIMPYGLEDVERRWPITDKLVEMGPANFLPLEKRLEQVNCWLRACGTGTLTGFDELQEYAASGEECTRSMFGLNFDREYRLELEVPYYVGDCHDGNGKAVVRFVGVSQCDHHFSASWAGLVCDFFDRFRRDPETGRLLVD